MKIVALKRKLSGLIGAMALAASLVACGSGGETDDGNSGQDDPTAEPTADDGDSRDSEGGAGGDDSSGD